MRKICLYEGQCHFDRGLFQGLLFSSIVAILSIKVALTVNFVSFFSHLQTLCLHEKQTNINIFSGVFFHLEHNEYCSTFTI